MNLQQLRFVKAVADTASFSQAAKLCCVTQPTLSNSIAQFEDEVGGRVFLRTTRKVSVTKFGEHILNYVKAVLSAQEELVASAKEYLEPQHKLLKIGFSPLIDMQKLNLALNPYREKHNDVEIFFKECYLDDLEGRLDNEAIDFAVLPHKKQSSNRASFIFYHEPLYYLDVEAKNKASNNNDIELKEIAKSTIILSGGGCGLNGVVSDLFMHEGLELIVYPGQALSYQVIQDWSSLGIGASILPASKLCDSMRDKAVGLKLNKDKPAEVSFDWVWKANTTKPEYMLDLIEHFKHVVPEIMNGAI